VGFVGFCGVCWVLWVSLRVGCCLCRAFLAGVCFQGLFFGFLVGALCELGFFFFVGALRHSLLYFLCNWVAPFQICAFLIYTTLLINFFFFFFFFFLHVCQEKIKGKLPNLSNK
jgi:hypothetical protein